MGLTVVTTSARAEQSVWEARYPDPLVVMMGSEGPGLADADLRRGRLQVSIPMTGTAESLNLAVATGVILYEVIRQRREPPRASQLVFIAVFVAAAAHVAAGEGLTTTLALPSSGDARAILAGSAILCLSFLGFDAVSTLSEETHEPRRTVPRAILLCTLASGLLFMLIAYAGQVVFPDWHAFRDLDSASLELMRRIGGGTLSAFFVAVYVAGCFASAMAGQASVTRVLFAMGRDRVLPERVFGHLHARLCTPVRATLAVGAVSLSALFITLDLASTMISFGALVAFAVVNLCVMRSYLGRPEHRRFACWIKFGVVPALGFAMNVWLWSGLSRQTFYVGLGWLALGLCQLLWLTRGFTRPAPTLSMN